MNLIDLACQLLTTTELAMPSTWQHLADYVARAARGEALEFRASDETARLTGETFERAIEEEGESRAKTGWRRAMLLADCDLAASIALAQRGREDLLGAAIVRHQRATMAAWAAYQTTCTNRRKTNNA